MSELAKQPTNNAAPVIGAASLSDRQIALAIEYGMKLERVGMGPMTSELENAIRDINQNKAPLGASRGLR